LAHQVSSCAGALMTAIGAETVMVALATVMTLELLLSGLTGHGLARASIVGKRTLKQLPECPRARDDLWLGPPPVLELSE
jgi:hypothetical protein